MSQLLLLFPDCLLLPGPCCAVLVVGVGGGGLVAPRKPEVAVVGLLYKKPVAALYVPALVLCEVELGGR